MQETSTQLDIIYHMMLEFTSSADINRTLHQGLDYIRTQIGAEAASFFYLHAEREILRCEACIGPIDITGLELQANQGIVGAVTQSDEMRFVPDVSKDLDFSRSVDAITGFDTRSMMCVPVSGNGNKFGAIQLINRQDGNYFSASDAALVSVCAKSAALALTNSQLTTHMLDADALKRDLAMASRVQESLFPKQKYHYIYGVNLPKKGVSGDLYDYVERNGRIYFCMADACGKGTDAALIMAKTHSLFHSLSRSEPSPAELTTMMNRELVETACNGMFVTAIIGVYNPTDGDMQCCNAGHEPGLIVHCDATIDYVKACLQPLGIVGFNMQDMITETYNLTDKRFYCYSDGITEAEIGGRMMGAPKLAEILIQQMDLPLATQIQNTVQIVKRQADLLPDDLTVLGLGCSPKTAHNASAQMPQTCEKNFTESVADNQLADKFSDEDALFTISLISEVPELRRVRREIATILADSAAAEHIDDIQRAVDEALQNIILYAYPENRQGVITIDGYIVGRKLYVSIVDNAPLIDLATIRPRSLKTPREGGLGTHFIMLLSEQAQWSHKDGANRLDLSFAI